MAIMMGKLYDALRKAGVDDASATAAAEEGAEVVSTMNAMDLKMEKGFADVGVKMERMRTDLIRQMESLRSDVNAQIASLRGELVMIKWMMGVLVALAVTMLVRFW